MKKSHKNDSAAEISAVKTKCFMLHMLRFLKLNSVKLEKGWVDPGDTGAEGRAELI